jgi:hypothetical protein
MKFDLQKYQKPLMDATEIDDDFDTTKQEIKTIFGNIHVLLNVNKQLLEEITTRLETWNENSMIGDVFVDVVCCNLLHEATHAIGFMF